MPDDLTWTTIARGLTERRPHIVLLEGDAARQLTDWRSAAREAGIFWLEPGPTAAQPVPFPLWSALAGTHPSGAALARRLRSGPELPEDDDCPVLPDAVGAYGAILRWLTQTGPGPVVVVLPEVDRAGPDCLDGLAYVARGVHHAPVALVLQSSGRPGGQHWERIVDRLTEEAGLIRIPGGPEPVVPERGTPSGVEYGIACCRAGALQDGGRVLAGALAGRDARPGDVPAWTHLAMAMLRRRRFDLVPTAVAGALALSAPGLSPPVRRLLRRLRMLALRGEGRGGPLSELGREAQRELAACRPDSAEQAWLRLDAALGSSLDGAPREGRAEHERLLRGVLDLEAASAQCRAAAHLWLGAFLTLNGDVAAAIPHQRAGLGLLESLDDESRGLVTRVRLAAALFGVGDAEAAPQFEVAAEQAWRVGDAAMTAECWCYAARAHAGTGRTHLADALLAESTRRQRVVWSRPRASLLRRHAVAVVTLARGDTARTEAMVGSLVRDLVPGENQGSSWIVRLACECAYLMADVAHHRGDDRRAADCAARGLAMAAQAAPEERAALLAAGQKRATR